MRVPRGFWFRDTGSRKSKSFPSSKLLPTTSLLAAKQLKSHRADFGTPNDSQRSECVLWEYQGRIHTTNGPTSHTHPSQHFVLCAASVKCSLPIQHKRSDRFWTRPLVRGGFTIKRMTSELGLQDQNISHNLTQPFMSIMPKCQFTVVAPNHPQPTCTCVISLPGSTNGVTICYSGIGLFVSGHVI